MARGEYPGSAPHVAPDIAAAKLTAFLNAGVTVFIDLTEPMDGLLPHTPALSALADERGVSVTHVPMPIRDMGVPIVDHMTAILDAIDAYLSPRRGVYVQAHGVRVLHPNAAIKDSAAHGGPHGGSTVRRKPSFQCERL